MTHFNMECDPTPWRLVSNGIGRTRHPTTKQSGHPSSTEPCWGGVRCVEIDAWDGHDGEPVVTHGLAPRGCWDQGNTPKKKGKPFADQENM